MRSRDELLDILLSLQPAELEVLITRMAIPVHALSGAQAAQGLRVVELFRFLEANSRLAELEARLCAGQIKLPAAPPQEVVTPPPLGHVRLASTSVIDAVLASGERCDKLHAGALVPARLVPLRRSTAPRAAPPSGAVLSFDLSNPNPTELRLTELRLQVVDFQPAQIVGQKTLLGAAQARRYVCSLNPVPAEFRCDMRDRDYDYIKLAHAEMEFFSIDLHASQSGVYTIRAVVEYSVAGSSGLVRSATQVLAFHDGPLRKPPLRRPSKGM